MSRKIGEYIFLLCVSYHYLLDFLRKPLASSPSCPQPSTAALSLRVCGTLRMSPHRVLHSNPRPCPQIRLLSSMWAVLVATSVVVGTLPWNLGLASATIFRVNLPHPLKPLSWGLSQPVHVAAGEGVSGSFAGIFPEAQASSPQPQAAPGSGHLCQFRGTQAGAPRAEP